MRNGNFNWCTGSVDFRGKSDGVASISGIPAFIISGFFFCINDTFVVFVTFTCSPHLQIIHHA